MPTGKPIQYDWGWWDLPEWPLVKWPRQHDEENPVCAMLHPHWATYLQEGELQPYSRNHITQGDKDGQV